MNKYIHKRGSEWCFCIPLRMNRWSHSGWRNWQGSCRLGPSDITGGRRHRDLGPMSLCSTLAGKLCSEWTKVVRSQKGNYFCEAKSVLIPCNQSAYYQLTVHLQFHPQGSFLFSCPVWWDQYQESVYLYYFKSLFRMGFWEDRHDGRLIFNLSKYI